MSQPCEPSERYYIRLITYKGNKDYRFYYCGAHQLCDMTFYFVFFVLGWRTCDNGLSEFKGLGFARTKLLQATRNPFQDHH
jgi:hypothetical protein